MTDNEIIKAVNYCANAKDYEDCEKCPIKNTCDNHSERFVVVVADLINRQKAEIERLTAKVNRLKKYDEERDIRLHARLTADARAEAIKEFAERLKGAKQYSIVRHENIVPVAVIDWILKEMVGDNNE
jgi:hypothetical protein